MGKVKSDLGSYLHGSPHLTESEKFIYTLKGYVETVVGKDQQTIKINFYRLYEESINRIKHQNISVELKHNQIRRLNEVKVYAERWKNAQEIFKFFFERQLEQTETFKRELLNYLELMAKQEMLAKAIFLLNLIKLLDEELKQIEDKIRSLEKTSQMIQAQVVNIAAQLVIDSLPAEIRNSPQADIIRERFAKQYSAVLSTEFKSTMQVSETNKTIVAIAEQVVEKSCIEYPKIASSYHYSLNEKIKGHQDLGQKLKSLKENRDDLSQHEIQHQKKLEQKNNALQELAKIPSEYQALASSQLVNQNSILEQSKDISVSKNSNNSTAMMSAKLSMPLKVLATEEEDFSMYEDESSSLTPQSNSAESIPSQDNLKDKESVESKTQKEVPDEPDSSLGLKPK